MYLIHISKATLRERFNAFRFLILNSLKINQLQSLTHLLVCFRSLTYCGSTRYFMGCASGKSCWNQRSRNTICCVTGFLCATVSSVAAAKPKTRCHRLFKFRQQIKWTFKKRRFYFFQPGLNFSTWLWNFVKLFFLFSEKIEPEQGCRCFL